MYNKEYFKDYYINNKEYYKNYYEKNKDKYKIYNYNSWLNNPEKYISSHEKCSQNYYEKNKEYIKSKRKKYTPRAINFPMTIHNYPITLYF